VSGTIQVGESTAADDTKKISPTTGLSATFCSPSQCFTRGLTSKAPFGAIGTNKSAYIFHNPPRRSVKKDQLFSLLICLKNKKLVKFIDFPLQKIRINLPKLPVTYFFFFSFFNLKPLNSISFQRQILKNG
jgi:hypothetical protein